MIKLAQEIPPEIGEWTPWTPVGYSNIPTFLSHTMGWFLSIIGALAVIAVIYSGFMYLTAAGNNDQAEKAKKNLTWAIVGLVLVAFAAIIVRVVNDVINSANPH